MTLDALLNSAMRAHENNDLDAAVRGYQSVLEAGARADVANLLAIALDQAGATEAAERVLATALAEDRSDPAAFLNLGRLLARRGAAKEALAPLRVAVEAGSQEAGPLYLAAATAALDHGQIIHAAETMLRDGSFQPEYWRQLVGACFQRGQKARAGGYAQAAVLSAPASVSISLLNAETAGALGRLSENTKQTGRAAMVAPGDPGVQSSLALARAAGGDREGGIRAYRRSLCLDPGIAERWNDYGALVKPTGELVSAGRCFDRAAMADPGLVMALRNRAGLFADVKESAKARALYERALALAPENTALAFLRVLTFPTIAPDEAAIEGIRAEIMAVMKQLSTSGARIADPLVDVGLPNFYLAYHGLNDREIQSTIADAYLALCPGLAFAAPHCKAPRPLGGPGERKLRVGFVSRFFHDHSIRYSTAGIMRNLDRSLFEVHVISDRSADQVTLFRPGEKADSHTVIPIDLGRARSVIAGLELDVLIYGDIGMEPLTYYLAFARLAPVQGHLQGHPVSPGIPNLDYFLTSALQEPEDHAEHYREMPVPFSGTLFCYEEIFPVPPASRAEFGLPETGALYFCPQTLFKFHPSFDRVLKGILEGDPSGWLVLLEDSQTARTRDLDARLRNSLAKLHDRVIWVPRQPKQRYFQLVTLAAVMLDTTFFSGANTTLQSLGLGVPVVTLPGPYVRGRMTLGWLQEADLMEMCAEDDEDYIRIALGFGLDPAWRAAVVARIEQARPRLFQQSEVVGEFQDFLREAYRAAAEGRGPIRWPGE